MKIKSAKAKGRNLQNLVRDKLRSIFVGKVLEEDDIKSQTMGMSGEDIVLTPAAKKLIPYSCLLVIRIGMNKETRMSHPCSKCMKLINKVGIRKTIYSSR